MRRITLASTAALTLVFASQAVAQSSGPSQGAPSAGSSSQSGPTLPNYAAAADRAQSADQTRSALSTANQLNSGNYGDATGSYRVVQQAQSYVRRYEAGEPNLYYGEVSSYYTAYTESLRRTGTGTIVNPDGVVVRSLVSELDAARAPGSPTTAAGSRRSSSLEDAQTDLLRNARPAATQQLELASALVNAARESGNSAFISRAQAMEAEARGVLDRLNGAVILSDAYHGRAFTSDGDALRYVAMRDEAVQGVMRRGEVDRTDNQTSFSNRSLALMSEMRAAFDGTNRNLGGPVNMLSADTIRNVEDQAVQSRAANRVAENLAAASRAVDGSPQGEYATNFLREYYTRLRAISSDFGENAPTARIDDLPTGPSRAGTAEQGRAEAVQTASGNGDQGTAPSAQPRQPGGPDYPTVSAEERARISREAALRRAAQLAQADAARQEALRQEQEAASAQQAELARREAARLANERARLAAASQARNAQDARWREMVEASFRTFQSPGWARFDELDPTRREALTESVWNAFEAGGGRLTVLQLEEIYRNYDLNRSTVIPPARSLSSAPNSLSSMFDSRLSLAGLPVRSGTDDYNDPAVQSLYEALYHLTQRRRGPLGPSEAEIQTANMGDYDLYSDPDGRWGRESGGYVAASLFSEELDYLSRSFVNGRNGLNGLLAQPFNVLLTWGDGANDLDLHLTGPTGTGATDRFHIYYAAVGSLQDFPFAQLIRDCICRSGSEVILTSNLLGGGVYRVSVFNFGDQGANSTNLANASNARIQIVRGGIAVAQGNGTTIQGGRLILDTTVPAGQFGNTWVAVELDPRTGRITVPRQIRQSEGSNNVR